MRNYIVRKLEETILSCDEYNDNITQDLLDYDQYNIGSKSKTTTNFKKYQRNY